MCRIQIRQVRMGGSDLPNTVPLNLILGVSTIPPQPVALQNIVGATGEGGPSQREKTDIQTIYHNILSPVSIPWKP